jgi:hypothetical protein
MIAVMKQEHATRPAHHQKCEERGVCFGRVAGRTRQNKIVRAVVRGLTAARANMVQRNGFRGRTRPAVSAHGSVLREQPITMGLH